MKTQIKKFSPHQNGKIVGILMAISSLIFVLPFAFFYLSFMPLMPPELGFFPFSGSFFLIFPILYFITGYVSVVVCSWVYNFLVRFIGGFEFELSEAPKKQEPIRYLGAPEYPQDQEP